MIFRENLPESLVPKALNRKIVVEITVGSYNSSLDRSSMEVVFPSYSPCCEGGEGGGGGY